MCLGWVRLVHLRSRAPAGACPRCAAVGRWGTCLVRSGRLRVRPVPVATGARLRPAPAADGSARSWDPSSNLRTPLARAAGRTRSAHGGDLSEIGSDSQALCSQAGTSGQTRGGIGLAEHGRGAPVEEVSPKIIFCPEGST